MASNLTVDTLTKGATTLNTDELVDVNNTRVAKAWVNFNGSGTVAIRSSYNISSITDNSVGNYTINFTTAMADVDYSVGLSATDNGTAGQTDGYAYGAWKRGANNSVFATTSLRIGIGYPITTTYYDQSIVNVQIFR